MVVALLVDLVLMRHGGPHRVTFKEALFWSLGWIGLALAFNALMDFHMMVKSRYPSVTLTPDLGKGLVDLFLRGAGPGGVERLSLPNPFLVQVREGGAWS